MLPSFLTLACSGPGTVVVDAINRAITTGYLCAAASGVITAAIAIDAWRRGRRRYIFWVAAVILAIHPAWTVSAVHGDCGALKVCASLLCLLMHAGLMLWHHILARRAT